MKDLKILILAGGSGERFWPLSTPDKPKQFLKLFNEKSLLRNTFERFIEFVKVEDIFVVTNERYVEKIKEELPEIHEENIISEPERNNTAPAITFSILNMKDDPVVLVVPADHYIPDVEKFLKSVEIGIEFLQENPEALITFGIVPDRPETGYGYIERGEKVKDGVYKVKMFREKPSYEVAKEFVESGNFYWNSGIFLWKKSAFFKEMEKHAVDVLKPLREKGKEGYSEVPSISIDYALMEKSDNVYVVEADFEWSDVGNWLSLMEIGFKGSDKVVKVDSERVFVISGKPVLVVGIDDVIVVENENGILVASMKDMERIREGVRRILNK